MKTNRIRPGTFPLSWKKWRKVRVGEKLRASDRVVLFYEKKPLSIAIGAMRSGECVRPFSAHGVFPFGFYFRRIA